MQFYLPTSSKSGRLRVEFYDLFATLLAGPIAFLLRDPNTLADGRTSGALLYCAVAAISGVLMLLAFDLGRGFARHATARDAFLIAQMSAASIMLTSALIFTFTRLVDIPRSIPVIHFLVLMSLLLGGRAVAIMRRDRRRRRRAASVVDPEQVLVVGANRLAEVYFRVLDSVAQGRTSVVALLDGNPRYLGRAVHGRPVLAPPSDLDRVVTEYKIHGVEIDRIVIAANRGSDPERWADIEAVCARKSLKVSFLADDLGIEFDTPAVTMANAVTAPAPVSSDYFRLKRGCEFVFAGALLVLLAPVLLILVVVILFDVGWPVVFWQKRVGLGGRPLLVYKFRTLHAPFDRRGEFVAEENRVSRLGNLLRRLRLDEMPQLWNIVLGNMSFVGPRPLLPEDQPKTSKKRLLVLPGITGWAQIHGGKLVSQDDKGVLDDWYVENASLGLDIKIMWWTLSTVIFGDRQKDADEAISDLEEDGAATPNQR